MAVIDVVDLTKRFGQAVAVAAVTLSISDGEFLVLVGPSGCGKSTLLRLIAGLEAPTLGSIAIDGRDVTRVPAKDRDIAMVFQSYALYPHMTAAENMAFSLRVRGVDRRTVDERVSKAAAIVNLTSELKRKPAELSGGQRQRVAMGRAIVRNPKVFLFDEPLSNLDAQLRVAMRAEIKELQQRLATTTIYVTHDQVEAMTLADRIVVMRAGAVEQIGSPLHLYDHPANVFVARFIGSPAMNMLPGKLRRNGQQTAVLLPGGIAVEVTNGELGQDGQDVLYGIRPEHLAVSDGSGSLIGKVVGVEPTGAQVLIIVEIASQRVIATSNDRFLPAVGTSLTLAPQGRQGHVFDTTAGRSLSAGT